MARGPLRAILGRAQELGYLGPGPVEEHLEHADALGAVLDTSGGLDGSFRALDLGSGGGVPGLILAQAAPASAWTLLDASLRRTDFLREAVVALGLMDRVTVIRGRAEEAARSPALRGRFDLVTARSFGPPAVSAECAVGFLTDHGLLAVSEPPEPDPQRWPAGGLATLGLRMESSGRWVLLRHDGPTPERWPRRVGIPAKRPLW